VKLIEENFKNPYFDNNELKRYPLGKFEHEIYNFLDMILNSSFGKYFKQ
jgi:hypothetical protein